MWNNMPRKCCSSKNFKNSSTMRCATVIMYRLFPLFCMMWSFLVNKYSVLPQKVWFTVRWCPLERFWRGPDGHRFLINKMRPPHLVPQLQGGGMLLQSSSLSSTLSLQIWQCWLFSSRIAFYFFTAQRHHWHTTNHRWSYVCLHYTQLNVLHFVSTVCAALSRWNAWDLCITNKYQI